MTKLSCFVMFVLGAVLYSAAGADSMSATLILDEDLKGHLYVRNEKNQIVVELKKEAGHAVELGLEPRAYEIYFEQDKGAFHASHDLEIGQELKISGDHFKSGYQGPMTWQRAGYSPARNPYQLMHRSRFELRKAGSHWTWNYSYWVREGIALQAIISGYDVTRTITDLPAEVSYRLVGMRYYLPGTTSEVRIKPYLESAAGVYSGREKGDGTIDKSAFGVKLGTGLDFHPLSNFMVGINGGYNLVPSVRLAQDVARAKRDLSGFEFGIGVSFLTGELFHTR